MSEKKNPQRLQNPPTNLAIYTNSNKKPFDQHTARQYFRQCRRAVTPEKRQATTAAILEKVKKEAIFQQAQKIAFYMAHDGEIDPEPIWQWALKQGKNCFLPVIDQSTPRLLHFKPFNQETTFKVNQYGIPEPQGKETIDARTLCLAFVPLVAFDKEKNRLGMGGGYYDTTFAFKKNNLKNPPQLLGLAHPCQQADRITPAPWDVALDAVLTG